MSEQALLEKPAAEAEDETPEKPEAVTPGPEDNPVQPADADPNETPAEDEGARLEREAREAEIDRLADEKAAKIVADSKVKAAETVREDAKKARTGEINLVTGGFGNVIAQLEANLKKAGIEDDDTLSELLSPLNGHNGKLKPLVQKFYDNATKEVAEAVSDWLVETTPEGTRADVKALVDADKPLSEVLPVVVEAMALGSDAVRKAKPEDLIEANKALKAHVAEQVNESYKKGRKNPYPDGEPETPAARPQGPSINSASENDRAYNAGLISSETWSANKARFRGGGK